MLRCVKRLLGSRRRRWAAAGAVVLVMAGLGGASVKLTSKSSFCKSCHLMESYHATWTQDAHNKIECVQCHIRPGFEHLIHAKLDGFAQMVNCFLGRASTRPAAHVGDDSCTRAGCHVVADLNSKDGTGWQYRFDHQVHLGLEYTGISLHCTTCHSYVRGDVHFEINTNACLTCHLVDAPSPAARTAVAGAPEPHASSDCRTCHAPPAEPIKSGGMIIDHAEYLAYGAACSSCHVGVTAAPAKVEDSRCLSCHGFGMERAPETRELHKIHASARQKVQCFNCHGLMQHGQHVQGASVRELDCRGCHDDSHKWQRAQYMHGATDGGDRSGSPALQQLPISPMFLAHVACTSCHVEPRGPDEPQSPLRRGSIVARATPAACDTCHRPSLGEQTITLWQRTTRELHEQVQALMPSPSRRAGAAPEVARLLHEAEQLLEMVQLDGSWGVHNPRYTEGLLHEAREKVLEARALMNGALQNGAQPPAEAPR